jgi:hypothetical protein
VPGNQVGFIAEDMVNVMPEVVGLDDQGRPNNIDYAKITPLLTRAMQEIATITGTFKANLVAWFADASNGIHDLYASIIHAQHVHSDDLCLKKSDGTEACITGDQLAAVASGRSAAGATTAGPGGSAGAPAATPAGGNSGPPVIAINGVNPATVAVGSTYNDLGATITGPQADLNLGIHAFVDGTATDPVAITQPLLVLIQ